MDELANTQRSKERFSLKNDESIIRTKEQNDSITNSFDPRDLFGRSEEPQYRSIVLPSNTFKPNKESEEISNQKRLLTDKFNKFIVRSSTLNSQPKIKLQSKSAKKDPKTEFRSRNGSDPRQKNVSFPIKTITEFDLKFGQNRRKNENDYFFELFKKSNIKSQFLNEKVSRVTKRSALDVAVPEKNLENMISNLIQTRSRNSPKKTAPSKQTTFLKEGRHEFSNEKNSLVRELTLQNKIMQMTGIPSFIKAQSS